jgi:ABC-2 type transport system permease protein
VTAGTALRTTQQPPEAPTRPPTRLVVGIAVRLLRRGAFVVSVLSGVLTAFVAAEYRSTFSSVVSASSLEALAQNPAIRTLFGPPVALDDPGGFTVWRTGTVVAVLVGVWGALTATRVTRGEEEAGRWDLLLAGRLRVPALVRAHVGVLLVATALPGVASTLGLLLAGARPPGALLFGAMIAGTGMAGAALGVLGAQLLAERRAASGFAVTVLLAGLLVRMVADGVPALGFLQWITPFGLLGRAQPFGAERWLPVPVLLAIVGAVAVLAVRLSSGRDVGSARVRGRDRGRAPSRLVRSLGGLAVHRVRRPVLTWGTGLAAYFLLIGLLARTMIEFLADNPLFAQLAGQAGLVQLGSVEGYVSAIFSLLAVPLGAFAAGRIAHTAADEHAGRLTPLYSSPVSRVRWAVTETGVVLGGVVLLAATTGLATWVGASWVGAGLGLGDAVAGALAVVPVALLCLGAALLALGWAPAGVIAIGVLPAAGGYLLLVFADSFRWPGWVRGLSPYAHLSPVPAAPVDLAGALGMGVVAVALAAVGLVGYARRDLRG